MRMYNDYYPSYDEKILGKIRNKDGEIAIVPEDIIIIGENAFRDCRFLQYVFIPNNVKSINNGAFSGCI